MNRKVINWALAIFAVLMFAVCFWSIYSDIHFDNQLKDREHAVQARLKQIRDAEDNYRRVYKHYCGDIDSLVEFVRTERSIKETMPDRELTQDEYESLAEEIGKEDNYSEDEIKRMIPERAVQKGLLRIDTLWEAVSDMIGLQNADSLKLVPVGKEGATISLRKRDVLDLKTGDVTTLVEFRASMDDYLDGMEKKRVDNYKSEQIRLGKQKQGLWADEDSVSTDKDDWVGLRMGDLFDASNKMAGNWNN